MNEIIYVTLEDLTVHPLNIELHGEDPKVDDLFVSIPEFGLIEPLEVTSNNEIIDGRRRHKTLQILEWSDPVPCTVYEGSDILMRILTNDQQKDKEPRYIYNAYLKLEPLFQEEAKQRMLAGIKVDLTAEQQQGQRALTVTDKCAKFLNISPRTLDRVKTIYRNEDEFPKIVKLLDERTLSIYGAEKKIRDVWNKDQKLLDLQRDFLNLIQRSVMRQSLQAHLLRKYTNVVRIKETKSLDNLKKEIFRNLGVPVGETVQERYSLIIDDLVRAVKDITISQEHCKLRHWYIGNRRYVSAVLWIDEHDAVDPLEREVFPETKFTDFEEADNFAESHGGHCQGLFEFGGRNFWAIFIKKDSVKEKEE